MPADAGHIFGFDSLRQSVEAASGGRQTVLYTAKNQPSIMNVIPAFNVQDIDVSLGTGIHPAFIVNSVEKSELFIGSYQGLISNGELISLPGVIPSVNYGFDGFVSTARANGAGWHIISSIEFSAIALWCYKNGFFPHGNTNYGQDLSYKYETGRRYDGVAPGDTSGTPLTITGSGPATWRHDGKLHGISDLNGNLFEWSGGLRIVSGEIQVIPNNDAALSTTDMSSTSSAWMAVDGSTGALVTPTHTGSIATLDYVPTTPNSVRYATSGTADYTLVRASGSSLEGMTNPGAINPVSASALGVLKTYGLYPVSASLGGDAIWIDPTIEAVSFRGGDWFRGGASGVFALYLASLRSYSSSDIGSRPAFVN